MLSPAARVLSSLPFLLLAYSTVPANAVPSSTIQSGTAQSSTAQSSTAQSGTPPAASLPSRYGNLPLSFEANQGQTGPSVQFLSHGQGYTLFLRSGEAVLTFQTAAQPGHAQKTSSVRVKLAGSNPNVTVLSEDPQITQTNYFLGNDPAKWHTGVPNYGRVRYRSIYDGIDLVYYGNQRQLEHDFIVAPHADPSKIALALEGAKQLRIDPATGSLVLSSDDKTSLRLLAPITYQQVKGRRVAVPSSYKLLPGNRVGFTLGSYDHTRALVIDPILAYSTYLGGSGANGHGDQGNGIAVDSSGNAYIVGTTYSANFPVTGGAFQPASHAAAGVNTVFVSKLNATGTALVYSTYLGGSGGDSGYGIALDSLKNAYVTGATYSSDFPVTCGAFQTVNDSTTTGAPTAFVSKLNATGNALEYSTYLGGSGNHASTPHGDVAQAVVVQAGKAYVTGYTYSSDFPATDAAFQTQFAGSATSSNAFVTELNVMGTALVYSTFLGGSGSHDGGDSGNALAIDSAGHVFVAGTTFSANFPVTPGALQTTELGLPTGSAVAFVTEFKPDGSDEVYSTYLGGSDGDSALAIAVDSTGFAYVGGITDSPDFPLTAGVVEGTNVGIGSYYIGGEGGAFVAKLNPLGTALAYSTYLEGQATSVTGLAVDSSGNAYLTGSTSPLKPGTFGGFQTTPDALPPPASQGTSAFLVKLDPLATVFEYATLLGGSANDAAVALALDGSGNVYVTGYADSTNFRTTGEAIQRVNKASATGGSNAFISKFALSAEANQTAYPGLPSGVLTSMTINSEEGDWVPDGMCDEYTITADVNLNTPIAGPPPTGDIQMYGPWNLSFDYPVEGSWGGTTEVSLWGVNDTFSYGAGDWQAIYSGDSIYYNSEVSGSVDFPPCTPQFYRPRDQSGSKSNSSQSQRGLQSAQIHGSLKIVAHLTSAGSTHAQSQVPGPKFTPASATAREIGNASSAPPSAPSQGTSSCIAPALPPLIVTVVSPVPRSYGAANPAFEHRITGLMNGDTVTVTLQTTATPTSPVGAYPITATVTGSALANYTLTVIPGTLDVRPAKLHIVASSVAVVYGHTPPSLTAYKLTGFLNGDTASVVSGAPVLSTTVTSTTPVGYYKIGIQTGTLTAANYVFSGVSNGEGVVDVTKAPLALKANNLTMTHGSPVPTLSYTLTGFVNGQSAAGTVTGTPVLTTTATSASAPGKYPITITQGSLAAANYSFVKVNGVLTVTP